MHVHPLGPVGGAPPPTVSPKTKPGIELGKDYAHKSGARADANDMCMRAP